MSDHAVFLFVLVTVLSTSEDQCSNIRHVEVSPDSPGYVTNTVLDAAATDQQLTSPRRQQQRPWSCMYKLSAARGQQISLKLYDFRPPAGFSAGTDSCNVYARVRDVSSRLEKAVCAGLPGERDVMTSQGNSLHLELPVTSSVDDRGFFLLKYECKFWLEVSHVKALRYSCHKKY